MTFLRAGALCVPALLFALVSRVSASAMAPNPAHDSMRAKEGEPKKQKKRMPAKDKKAGQPKGSPEEDIA